jgi:hypothetical protein
VSSNANSRVISRELANEWGLPYELGTDADDGREYGLAVELHREQAGTRRWYSVHNLVFRAPDDGEAYLVTYRRGLTELQEQDPWDDESAITVYPVEPYEELVTRWRKLV